MSDETQICPACHRHVFAITRHNVQGVATPACLSCVMSGITRNHCRRIYNELADALPFTHDGLMNNQETHAVNYPGCMVDWTGRANWSLDPNPPREPIELSSLRTLRAMERVITDNPDRRFIWDPPRPWWQRWDHDYWQRG